MAVNIFLVGPTASGKSGLAVELAGVVGGVVANLDAFQVYRGMDIGTGKPTVEERGEAPHVLYDLADPLEAFSVADYLKAAAALAEEKRPVIWTGGTGLYYRLLRRGLTPAPASDPVVVAALEAMPDEARVEEIRRVDPEWAERADLANPRRVIRALAVFRQTGRPLSVWHREPLRPLVTEGRAFFLRLRPELLRRRITARVGEMWGRGWPEEVRRLAGLRGWESAPSFRALGYAEVLDWVRQGGSVEACQNRIALRTWQYARRQLTWFRREHNLEEIFVDESFAVAAAARAILRAMG